MNEYGMGTQKLAHYLKETYNAESLVVESETVRSPNKIAKFKASLEALTATGEMPILI